MPADALADEIASLAAHLDAATHRLLTCVREFDEAGGWHQQGALSCAHWLSWRIGLDPATAREKVRVARALGQLPKIDDALRRGALSYTKVRALTRVATPALEERLLEVALHATAAQLERICRQYRLVVSDPGGAADERCVRQRHLPGGMVRLEIVLHPDEAALVLRAIEKARGSEKDTPDVSAGASRPAGAAFPDRVDGLMMMAESFLARGPAAGHGGERFQVFVHVDQDPLGADGALAATLDDGTRVSAEALRRVSCDAAVVASVSTEAGTVLDVGRRTRTIPPAIRRALHLRDGGCRFPGCTNRTYVHGHHIQHWVHGGETKLGNLVLLCSAHHRLVHEGGFAIASAGDGQIVFSRPDGRAILPVVPVDLGDARGADELARWGREQGLDLDPGTNLPAWDGTAPDYGWVIDSLLAGP